MMLAEKANCCLRKEQNDLIKEKNENINIKENLGNSPSKDGEFLQMPPEERVIDNLTDSNGNFKF